MGSFSIWHWLIVLLVIILVFNISSTLVLQRMLGRRWV